MAVNNNPFTCSHVAFSLYYVFKENQVSTLTLCIPKIFKIFLGSLINIISNL